MPNLEALGFDAAEDYLPRYVELALDIEPRRHTFNQLWQCKVLGFNVTRFPCLSVAF